MSQDTPIEFIASRPDGKVFWKAYYQPQLLPFDAATYLQLYSEVERSLPWGERIVGELTFTLKQGTQQRTIMDEMREPS